MFFGCTFFFLSALHQPYTSGICLPEFILIGACFRRVKTSVYECYIQYFALAQFVRFFSTLPCAWSDKLVKCTVRIRLLNTLNPSTLQCVRLFACDVIGHFHDLNYNYSIENFASKVRD